MRSACHATRVEMTARQKKIGGAILGALGILAFYGALMSLPKYAPAPSPSDAPVAATPASEAASQRSLAPQIAETLKVKSDDPRAEEALAKLQAALADQARDVIALQQVMLRVQQNLGTQLRALTRAGDPQGRARVAGLLEYNSAVYRWAAEAAGLPPDQRDATLNWGLSGDNLDLIADAYGSDAEAKSEAIRRLAKQEVSAGTDSTVRMLIAGRDREASLLMVDSIYDRKPSPGIVDAVCDRAFGYQLIQLRLRQQPAAVHTLTLHGRGINVPDSPNSGFTNNNASQQDSEVAADLLISWNNSHAADRFEAYFTEMTAAAGTTLNDGRILNLLSPNNAVSITLGRLVDVYKPKTLVPMCVKVFESAPFNPNDQNINNNNVNEKYHSSSRIDAAAMFARTTGQDPASLGLVRFPNYSNSWMIKGSGGEENELLKTIHAWLKDHGKDYGVPAPGVFPLAPVR